MKKIKIFFVTYNSPESLNLTLESCFASSFEKNIVEISIINNHSNFSIKNEFVNKVKVFNNCLRPDFSLGHLSRNWNQAIVNGFKDLKSPDCDILITCQDDAIWNNNWVQDIIDIHEKYTFYCGNWGDMFCSYTPESIKKIGLWDERFCTIQYQEADYFTRANIYNGEKSSINDSKHSRILNKTKEIVKRPNESMTDRSRNSSYFEKLNCNLFKMKWGNRLTWNKKINDISHSMIPSYFYYPYFEKDMENPEEKGYFLGN